MVCDAQLEREKCGESDNSIKSGGFMERMREEVLEKK